MAKRTEVSKRLGPSRLHELKVHNKKKLFVSLIEFIRSKHSCLFARVTGVQEGRRRRRGPWGGTGREGDIWAAAD